MTRLDFLKLCGLGAIVAPAAVRPYNIKSKLDIKLAVDSSKFDEAMRRYHELTKDLYEYEQAIEMKRFVDGAYEQCIKIPRTQIYRDGYLVGEIEG